LPPELVQVGDLFPPADRCVAWHGGSTAPPLVVVDQLAAASQRIESGKKIVVVSAGTAVENHRWGALPDTALENIHAAYSSRAGLSHCH
jgi:hypothetical protein